MFTTLETRRTQGLEKTIYIGKYKLNGVIHISETPNKDEKNVSLMLSIDDYRLYIKTIEIVVCSKGLAEATIQLIASNLMQAYGLMLLPDLIKWKDELEDKDTSTPPS